MSDGLADILPASSTLKVMLSGKEYTLGRLSLRDLADVSKDFVGERIEIISQRGVGMAFHDVRDEIFIGAAMRIVPIWDIARDALGAIMMVIRSLGKGNPNVNAREIYESCSPDDQTALVRAVMELCGLRTKEKEVGQALPPKAPVPFQ